MNSIVQLASGSLRSEPVADAGTSIADLRRGDVPALPTTCTRTVAHVRLFSCHPLDRASLRLTPSLQRAVVYTHRNLAVISIGPVSDVNNALTMAQGDTRRLADLGVYLLQPGESFGAHMPIESGPTP